MAATCSTAFSWTLLYFDFMSLSRVWASLCSFLSTPLVFSALPEQKKQSITDVCIWEFSEMTIKIYRRTRLSSMNCLWFASASHPPFQSAASPILRVAEFSSVLRNKHITLLKTLANGCRDWTVRPSLFCLCAESGCHQVWSLGRRSDSSECSPASEQLSGFLRGKIKTVFHVGHVWLSLICCYGPHRQISARQDLFSDPSSFHRTWIA